MDGNALADGDAAGDIVCLGIEPGDFLISVMHFSTKASIAVLDDMTSEFSITATDTINNEGGTPTRRDQLLVTWEDLT